MQRQALHLTKRGIFIAHWAIELMAGILIVLIVSPLRSRSVWGAAFATEMSARWAQAAKQPSSQTAIEYE